jgi:acylphosphatase
MIAKFVHYTGNVQGVGFRATASIIARDYPVVGYVRNLDDGRVEMMVEGEVSAVDEFLREIRERWGDDISDVHVQTQEASGRYARFSIAP